MNDKTKNNSYNRHYNSSHYVDSTRNDVTTPNHLCSDSAF